MPRTGVSHLSHRTPPLSEMLAFMMPGISKARPKLSPSLSRHIFAGGPLKFFLCVLRPLCGIINLSNERLKGQQIRACLKLDNSYEQMEEKIEAVWFNMKWKPPWQLNGFLWLEVPNSFHKLILTLCFVTNHMSVCVWMCVLRNREKFCFYERVTDIEFLMLFKPYYKTFLMVKQAQQTAN